MFVYEKKLQYPVKIKNTNPKLASIIITQYGGPYGSMMQKPKTNVWFSALR
jgi:spore coat protein JC